MERKNQLSAMMKSLVVFCIPLVLSGMLQQLYNWADAFIVGNVEGETALAAIGSTTAVVNFFITLMTGFALGLSVLAARNFGEGKNEKNRNLLSGFVVIFAVFFSVVSVVCAFFSGGIMRLLNTTPDSFDLAVSYIRIIFFGFPFLGVYNVYSAVLRGAGDSKSPFLSVVVSSVINVGLDIVFVAVLKFGVKGAAAATVISQVLMTVFTVLYSRVKHPELRLSFAKEVFSSKLIKAGFSYGLPPMIQSCVTSVGSLILQNFMNGFGTDTVVAITTAYRIDTLVMLPIVNLGSGISAVASRHLGAGEKEQTRLCLKAGTVLALGVSVLLTAFVIPTGGKIIALFGAGEKAVKIGTDFFVRIACFYPVFGLATALRGYCEGVGDLVFSGAAGISHLVLRIILSYAGAGLFGNMIIAYAEMAAWVFLLLLYVLRIAAKRKENRTAFYT